MLLIRQAYLNFAGGRLNPELDPEILLPDLINTIPASPFVGPDLRECFLADLVWFTKGDDTDEVLPVVVFFISLKTQQCAPLQRVHRKRFKHRPRKLPSASPTQQERNAKGRRPNNDSDNRVSLKLFRSLNY